MVFPENLPAILNAVNGWWDLLLLVGIALAPSVVQFFKQRKHGDDIAAVRESVVNSHTTNLRDDVDEITGTVNGLRGELDKLTVLVSGLSTQLQGVVVSLEGIRADIRQGRVDHHDLEVRLAGRGG